MTKFVVQEYTPKFTDTEESDLESNDSNERDSDVELQEALISGKLKPGLHAKLPYRTKLEINNIHVLKSKLNDFQLNLNWIERLDLTGNIDELPDHISNPLKDQNINAESNDLDVIRNDIKREIKFMLQAKSSVIQGLERLHALKVKTKRPDDYFAEMLKSKDHMDKILKVKEKKKELAEKKEKSKLIREQKKMGKKIQQEVLKQRQKEKKEFQEKIKKCRKGNIKSADLFSDEKNTKGQNQRNKRNDGSKNKNNGQLRNKNKLSKREFKQSKFGYGGRKKGTKKNTAESSASFTSFKSSRNSFNNKKSNKRSRN